MAAILASTLVAATPLDEEPLAVDWASLRLVNMVHTSHQAL